jgi:hypothetical protein
MIHCITGENLKECPYPHCACGKPGSEASGHRNCFIEIDISLVPKDTDWMSLYLKSGYGIMIEPYKTSSAGKRGNFVWSSDNNVEFVEHENGAFLLGYDPYKQQ